MAPPAAGGWYSCRPHTAHPHRSTAHGRHAAEHGQAAEGVGGQTVEAVGSEADEACRRAVVIDRQQRYGRHIPTARVHGRSGVDVQRITPLPEVRRMRMAGDQDTRVGPDRLSPCIHQVMKHLDNAARQCHGRTRTQRRIRFDVSVSEHSGHRGDRLKLTEHGSTADITRMDDVVHAFERLARSGGKGAVGI